MEVTTVRDFWFLMAMNVPLTAILMVLAWRLNKVNFLSPTAMVMYLVCAARPICFPGLQLLERKQRSARRSQAIRR